MSDHCPKCGAERAGESCPKCGLVFARFDKAALETQAPESLKALWRNVEERWDDKASHALFVEQALISDSLGYAAGCYRRRGDDEMARAQLQRISDRLQKAMVATAAKKSKGERKPRSAMVLIIVLFAATVAFSLFGILLLSK